MKRRRQLFHTCDPDRVVPPPDDDFDCMYGGAIGAVVYDEGESSWGADNGEYRSPIAYCPWCGVRLEVPPGRIVPDAAHESLQSAQRGGPSREAIQTAIAELEHVRPIRIPLERAIDYHYATIDLLRGLLAGIERITDAAFAAQEADRDE